MKGRVVWVDWAKALGIYFVVLGHYILPNAEVRGYIYMFHMPLFFFLSGLLTSDKSLNMSFGGFVKIKAKRLIVPYYLFSVLCFVWYLIKLKAGGGLDIFNTTLPILINSFLCGDSPMSCGPAWLLWSLFFCNICVYAYKRYPVVMLILLSTLGVINLPIYLALHTVPCALLFFAVGFIGKDKIINAADYIVSKKVIALIASVVCLVLVWVGYRLIGNMDMVADQYTSYPVFSLIFAFIGIFGVISLCTLVAKQSSLIESISRSTLVIMCLHTELLWFIQLHVYDIFSNWFVVLISAFAIVVGLTAITPFIRKYVPILMGGR